MAFGVLTLAVAVHPREWRLPVVSPTLGRVFADLSRVLPPTRRAVHRTEQVTVPAPQWLLVRVARPLRLVVLVPPGVALGLLLAWPLVVALLVVSRVWL